MKTRFIKQFQVGILAMAGLLAAPTFGATIIFDIGGVLSASSNVGLVQEIGFFSGILPYVLAGNNPARLIDQTFETLDYLFGKQQATPGRPLAYGEGQPLPQIMCLWLAGTIPAATIISEANRLIDAGACDHLLPTQAQKICIKRVITCCFDPAIYARHSYLIPNGVRLVKACRRAGHRVLILSNYAPDAFAACLEKPAFKKFFGSIGAENIVVSGFVGMIKPHADIFEYTLQKYQLNPGAEQVVFIDNQEENIAAAERAGIIGLLLQDDDYGTMYDQLEELGLPVRAPVYAPATP
jgi:phosphoglycolate phosphatase-like HAD superfamily hydrolase